MSSEEKNHYESLITFLKYSITITGAFLTIIISVGIYFTFNSTKEMKDDIRSELNATKNNISTYLDQSQKEIKSLNDYTKTSLIETKSLVDNTLGYVRQEAKNTAIYTSKEKVEEAFRENNIQDLINRTAEDAIKVKIDLMIKDQIQKSNEKLMEVLNIMPDFMLSVDKFRQGDRKALIYLDSIRKYSKDTLRIQIADKIIQGKKIDYLNAYGNEKKEELLSYLDIDPTKQDTTCIALKPKLRQLILNDKDLNVVCFATILLSKCYGKQIDLFDFDFIKGLE